RRARAAAFALDRADAPRRLDTIAPRHMHVHEHEAIALAVAAGGKPGLERRRTAGGGRHAMTEPGQPRAGKQSVELHGLGAQDRKPVGHAWRQAGTLLVCGEWHMVKALLGGDEPGRE